MAKNEAGKADAAQSLTVLQRMDSQPDAIHKIAAPAPQIMEEIMAKSKAGKAERQMQREDDLAATEALDATFRELLAGPALATILRPKGEKMCALPSLFWA